ncbi:MAG: hypothetical protein KDD50_10635 [Bdellovibrionales bacterium]|nr:hypothetical protein [Bdellovibrionales bacterium]
MREVLGIQKVIEWSPSGDLVTEPKQEDVIPLIIAETLDSHGMALVQNMMKAIHVSNFKIINGSIPFEGESLNFKQGIIFGERALKASMLTESPFEELCSQWSTFNGKSFIVTHELKKMLVSEFPGDIKMYKKQVWQDLKNFKSNGEL